jgi:hypothetical protein
MLDPKSVQKLKRISSNLVSSFDPWPFCCFRCCCFVTAAAAYNFSHLDQSHTLVSLISIPVNVKRSLTELSTILKTGRQKSNHIKSIGIWQGVAMDYLTFHPGPSCLSLLHLTSGPPLKRPYSLFRGRFRGSLPAGRVACGHLLPLWTPPRHMPMMKSAVSTSASHTFSFRIVN